jgi:hypothetical protein
MVVAVAITRTDFTAGELSEAATNRGADWRILCDWVRPYNAEGSARLRYRS